MIRESVQVRHRQQPSPAVCSNRWNTASEFSSPHRGFPKKPRTIPQCKVRLNRIGKRNWVFRPSWRALFSLKYKQRVEVRVLTAKLMPLKDILFYPILNRIACIDFIRLQSDGFGKQSGSLISPVWQHINVCTSRLAAHNRGVPNPDKAGAGGRFSAKDR